MTEERDETFSSRLSNRPCRLDALKPARSFPLLSLTGTFKSPFSVKYTLSAWKVVLTKSKTFPHNGVMFGFSRSEFRGLSAIFVAIGEVTFGFALAGITVLSLDVSKLLVIVLELLFAVEFWVLSLVCAEKGKL